MKSRKWLWCWLAMLLGSLLWSDRLLAITTAPYFPIDAGNSWTYSWTDNGFTGTSTTTVLDTPVLVNGVTTIVVQESDGELTQTYMTNDQNGIREHREYVPSTWIDGFGFTSVDMVFSPPMKMVDAETTVGASLYSTGTAMFTIAGLGTFPLTYTLTSSIDGLENITVPAGTYQAVKNTQKLTIAGSVLGEYLSIAMTRTLWLTKGIGIVKSVASDSDGHLEAALTATNVASKVTPTAGENGTILPNTPQYVPDNETITFTVTPEPFYLIESVTGCGGTLTGYSYTTAPVSEDCEVVATFYRPQSASLPWLMLLLEDE